MDLLEENGVNTVGVGVGEDIPDGVSSPIDMLMVIVIVTEGSAI